MSGQSIQSFDFKDIKAPEVEAIMNCLNEQPAKISRAIMNKLESQIMEQVIAAQRPPAPPLPPLDKAPVPPEDA